jgi:glutathione S-transferase
LVDIRDAAARSNPAFRAASPMGKVPALEDGGTRLWDSGAICAYLADQYPAAGLAPAIGHPDRGAYLQWLMYTNSVIEPAMVEKFSKAPVSTVGHGWGSFELMLEVRAAGRDRIQARAFRRRRAAQHAISRASSGRCRTSRRCSPMPTAARRARCSGAGTGMLP